MTRDDAPGLDRRVWQVGTTTSAFGAAAGELSAFLSSRGLSDRVRHDLELVFEEIVTNIVRHGELQASTEPIVVTLEIVDGGGTLSFEDRGRAFDPTAAALAAPPRSLDEVSVGGYGLVLVRKTAARMEYQRTSDGRNRLTVSIVGPRGTSTAP